MVSNTFQSVASDLLFTDLKVEPQFSADGFQRVEQQHNDACSQLINIHSKYGAQIHYLRITAGDTSTSINFSSPLTVNRVLEGGEFGTLLSIHDQNSQQTVWFPSALGQFCFDEHQRIKVSYNNPSPNYMYKLFNRVRHYGNITTSCTSISHQWTYQPHIQLSVQQPIRTDEVIVVPYVVLEDPEAQFLREFSNLSDVEQCLYRKSSWFFANTPAAIWNYLINGSIYDPRALKGVDKRFKCQQCAYAWWNYFNFLYKRTNKKLYILIRNEIAYSVLFDMSDEGEWGHGYWSDDIETHARFHLDGLHLLISQYEKTKEAVWLEAAERGMNFVSEHLTEQLDDGSLWFLHDTIEYSKRHHFRSTLWGKTPENSLCVNTHVQALTVLHRLRVALPEKTIYANMFENGIKSLRRLLDHQPGEPLYRLLMLWIMKHKTRKNDLLRHKVINRLERHIISTIYWSIRRHFPRIVHPGGFIARDLTLSFVSYGYHILNLKDFLTLYQQEPLSWLRSYIENSYEFVSKFLVKLDLIKDFERNNSYIELIDIFYLYNRLIKPVPSEEMHSVEQKIYQQTGGYSLDYYASELVRDYSSYSGRVQKANCNSEREL